MRSEGERPEPPLWRPYLRLGVLIPLGLLVLGAARVKPFFVVADFAALWLAYVLPGQYWQLRAVAIAAGMVVGIAAHPDRWPQAEVLNRVATSARYYPVTLAAAEIINVLLWHLRRRP